MPRLKTEFEQGYAAARVDYQARFDFLNSPARQVAIAKRLAVQCPTCWVKEFEWCVLVRKQPVGQHTIVLHVTRQAK